MFEGIAEIWEADDEEEANILLKRGWKILQIVQRMKSVTEQGWIHSKFVGVESETVYVMGRTEKIPSRKHEYESISSYTDRVKETTA